MFAINLCSRQLRLNRSDIKYVNRTRFVSGHTLMAPRNDQVSYYLLLMPAVLNGVYEHALCLLAKCLVRNHSYTKLLVFEVAFVDCADIYISICIESPCKSG